MTLNIKKLGLLLLISTIFVTPQLSFAACGAETREVVDSLKCNDGESGWLEISVNKMCGTISGVQQTVLEIEEKRPGLSNVQNTIFAARAASMIAEAKGQKEFQLFSQRAGANGRLEAYGSPSSDNKLIDKVRLSITPNQGEACAKTVDVSGVWSSIWN